MIGDIALKAVHHNVIGDIALKAVHHNVKGDIALKAVHHNVIGDIALKAFPKHLFRLTPGNPDYIESHRVVGLETQSVSRTLHTFLGLLDAVL